MSRAKPIDRPQQNEFLAGPPGSGGKVLPQTPRTWLAYVELSAGRAGRKNPIRASFLAANTSMAYPGSGSTASTAGYLKTLDDYHEKSSYKQASVTYCHALTAARVKPCSRLSAVREPVACRIITVCLR
jgi:hypothetical protein